MSRSEGEVVQVLLRQGREVEVAVREVDALVRPQLFAIVPRSGDLDMDLTLADVADDTADTTVVEPDPLACPHLSEDLGEGAGNRCDPGIAWASWLAGAGAVRQHQHVTPVQNERLRGLRDPADFAVVLAAGILRAGPAEHGVGRDVRRLRRGCPAAAAAGLVDPQRPPGAARIEEFHGVARDQPLQPAAVHLQAGVRARWGSTAGER